MTDRLTYLMAKFKAGVELTPEECVEYLSLAPPPPPKIKEWVDAEVARYKFLLRETEREDEAHE